MIKYYVPHAGSSPKPSASSISTTAFRVPRLARGDRMHARVSCRILRCRAQIKDGCAIDSCRTYCAEQCSIPRRRHKLHSCYHLKGEIHRKKCCCSARNRTQSTRHRHQRREPGTRGRTSISGRALGVPCLGCCDQRALHTCSACAHSCGTWSRCAHQNTDQYHRTGHHSSSKPSSSP